MSAPGPWQYKGPQRRFTTWLLQNSSSTLLALCSTPLKSHEMLRLARSISASGLRVPEYILRALDETISGRKAAQIGFWKGGDYGHTRFIESLMEVREILVPRETRWAARPRASPVQDGSIQLAASPLATRVQDQAITPTPPSLAAPVSKRKKSPSLVYAVRSRVNEERQKEKVVQRVVGWSKSSQAALTFENLHFVVLEYGGPAERYYLCAIHVEPWLSHVLTEVSAEDVSAAIRRGCEQVSTVGWRRVSSCSTADSWETRSSDEVFVGAREEAWELSPDDNTPLVRSHEVDVAKSLVMGSGCDGSFPGEIDPAVVQGGPRDSLLALMGSVESTLLDVLDRVMIASIDLWKRYRVLLVLLYVLETLWRFYMSRI